MSYYNNNGGSQQGGGRRPEPENEFKGVGLAQSRGKDKPIVYYPFANGGGAIHINLQISKDTGKFNEQGQPMVTRTFIPVNIFVNKVIPEQMIKSIQVGTKIRIVGELRSVPKKDRNDNQYTSLEVNAFVLQILEQPNNGAQPYGPGPAFAPQPSGYPQPGPGYGQPAGWNQQPAAPAPGYPAQGAPAPYGQPTGGYGQPAGYPAPQQPAAPGYAQPAPAGYGYGQKGGYGPATPAPAAPAPDDLPPAGREII